MMASIEIGVNCCIGYVFEKRNVAFVGSGGSPCFFLRSMLHERWGVVLDPQACRLPRHLVHGEK